MVELLLLILGMTGLWFGSEVLIRGATALTDRYHLSDAAFGMIVLAIGTDLPEIFVAVDASVRSLDSAADFSGVVVGSAIGSSIGQFALVFGIGGFFGYQAMRRRFLVRNTIFLLGSIIALAGFALDGQVSRIEGGLLAAFYAAYLYILISRRAESPDAAAASPGKPPLRAWLWLAVGLVLLLVAAEVTVASAIGFAEVVGLSDIAVSAILIGMGSSLPELSISIAALLKKRERLAAGNLVGSNVLDTMLVPGLAAIISPLTVTVDALMIDLPVLFAVTALILGFLYVSRRGVQKPEAVILLVIYSAYVFVRLTGPGS